MNTLESILLDIPIQSLPSQWQWGPDELKRFSNSKTLFSFQQEAVENALKRLWLFYGADKELGEPGIELKKRWANYANKEVSQDFSPNRMGFWMATGSGKTLVITKVMEMLGMLIDNGQIPEKDIMFLVYRENLIKQFKSHVAEYNASNPSRTINLIDLKEYERMKHGLALPRSNTIINVFYYRADLFVENKSTAKKINPDTCDNNGNWYVLLDEAHRGDSTDSPLQKIYNKFSRDGFLFNFSATFTDKIDIETCAYNFNLSKFIEAGYGKKIYVSDRKAEGFSKKDNFSDKEKQETVLRAIVLQAYINGKAEQVKKANSDLYHTPLMLTIVNQVNTSKARETDSDLILFFRELEKIASRKVENEVFSRVKRDLAQEMKEAEYVLAGDSGSKIQVDPKEINSITYEDLLWLVFNSTSPGKLEAKLVPGNTKEIVFQIRASSDPKPFALIRIGDISKWVREILMEGGYELNESYDNASYFEELNEEDSDIKILMGSRTFYEGWDSNRPNVIFFINIGISGNAKKFVLQAVGRGVRIEPEKGKRKRIKHLYNSGNLSEAVRYGSIKELSKPIESLFVFGTNAKNLKELMSALSERTFRLRDSFQINQSLTNKPSDCLLLVPTYKTLNKLYAETETKLPISKDDLAAAQALFRSQGDPAILLKYDCGLDILARARSKMKELNANSRVDSLNNPDFFLKKILDYLSIKDKAFDKVDDLRKDLKEGQENERIVHFKEVRYTGTESEYLELVQKMRSILEHKGDITSLYDEFNNSLEKVKNEKERKKLMKQLHENLKLFENASVFRETDIKHIAPHYYHPLLVTQKEKVDYLKHIIDVPSEIFFIRELQKEINKVGNVFKNYDWWMFSKLDAILDEVFIPYYNPKQNDFANFKPDFIFWFQKGKKYHILFLDPKGGAHTDYQKKADGYTYFFETTSSSESKSKKNELDVSVEKPQARNIKYKGLDVNVHLKFFGEGDEDSGKHYRRFWINSITALTP